MKWGRQRQQVRQEDWRHYDRTSLCVAADRRRWSINNIASCYTARHFAMSKWPKREYEQSKLLITLTRQKEKLRKLSSPRGFILYTRSEYKYTETETLTHYYEMKIMIHKTRKPRYRWQTQAMLRRASRNTVMASEINRPSSTLLMTP